MSILLGTFGVFFSTGLRALQIESPTSARNDLYPSAWNPSPVDRFTVVRNAAPGSVAAGYDLASIGWISGLGTPTTRANHVTLGTPTHVFQARHMGVNALPVGRTLHFVGRNSQTTSTDSDVDPGQIYFYRVTAGMAGVGGAPSAE